jgi:hypothetical protein
MKLKGITMIVLESAVTSAYVTDCWGVFLGVVRNRIILVFGGNIIFKLENNSPNAHKIKYYNIILFLSLLWFGGGKLEFVSIFQSIYCGGFSLHSE